MKGETDYRPMPPFCSPDIQNTGEKCASPYTRSVATCEQRRRRHHATACSHANAKGEDFLLHRDEEPLPSHDRRFERGS